MKKLKKGLLQKMFPRKNEKVPQLRFPGFNDEWQDKRLGEFLVKNTERNKNLVIDNVESVSNKLGFVKQTEQFEDYSVASENLSNYFVIKECQFAYNPSRINVGSIGYKEKGELVSVVSPLYVSFSTVKDIDDRFLWYWIKTELFERQRREFSEGGVRENLSFKQFSEMKILLPKLIEQAQIGNFFKDIDDLIKLQERKIENLKLQKKALLQQMFV